jgi:CHAT domain-containing protein
MDPRPVNDLAADLRGLVYLAFLNACRTADSREPGANLALALVQHGIPAVLGTQYQVLDEAAAHFARTFYRLLASGQHPAQALYRARLQLKNQFRSEPREWAIPVLYLAQNYAWQVQRPVLNEPLRPLEPHCTTHHTTARPRSISRAFRWPEQGTAGSGAPLHQRAAKDRHDSRRGRDG